MKFTTYRLKTFIFLFVLPLIALGIISAFDLGFEFLYKSVPSFNTWLQNGNVIYNNAVLFTILKFILPSSISIIFGIILSRKYKDNTMYIFSVITCIFLAIYFVSNIQSTVIPAQIDLAKGPKEFNSSNFSIISTKFKTSKGGYYFRYTVLIQGEYLELRNFGEDFKMKFNCQKTDREDDYECDTNSKVYYLENLHILMKE